MDELIFQKKTLGSNLSIYADRLVYKYALKETIIPICEIAAVNFSKYYSIKVEVETTGGKKLEIIEGNQKVKEQIRDAVYKAKSINSSPTVKTSNLDDLERLAGLREKGIITEEEFQSKKKQLLNL